MQKFYPTKEEQEKIKEDCRQHLPDLLAELGIVDLNKNFHCLNPMHHDDTPSMHYYSDSQTAYCYGCNETADIYRIYSWHTGIPENDKRLFDEVFAKYGYSFGSTSNFIKPVKFIAAQTKPKENIDYSNFLANAATHIYETDYWNIKRHLNQKTIEHFKLGYIDKWRHPSIPEFVSDNEKPFSPALIIPTGDGIYSYVARLINVEGNGKSQKVGGSYLFNIPALNQDVVICVEGEIDAMSLWQIGINAVGLGGTGNKKKFVDAIQNLSVKPKMVLLALDNDNAGIETANWIQQQLDNFKIPSNVAVDVYGKFKDANEFLCNDENNINSIFQKAIDDSIHKSNFYISTQAQINSNEKNIHNDEKILQQKIQQFYDSAITILKSVTNFTDEVVLSDSVLKAASICQIYQPITYKKFIDSCKIAGLAVGFIQKSVNKFNVETRRTLRQLQDDLQKYKYNQIIKANKIQQEKIENENVSRLESLSKQDELSQDEELETTQLVNSLLMRNDKGELLTNVCNYEVFLNHDYYLKDCIGYDSFAYRLIALKKNLPWRKNAMIEVSDWTDKDDAGVQNRINRISGGLNNTPMYKRVMLEFAHNHSIHPVRDYFNSLPIWDGKSRAESVFIDALGVPDSEYARKISMRWLIAAVARVFYPGCKFDFCLVLKSPQGAGKGTIIRKLATREDWFNSSIRNITTKDALQDLQARWIIELEEFKALSKVNDEYAKGFISASTDKFRPPYGTIPESYPRQCIFAASTNAAEFLKDRTGGRRWWILVSDKKSDSTVERLKKFTKDYINRIWAEVFFKFNQLFKDGFDSVKLLPEQHILDKAEEIAIQYTEGGGTAGMIQEFLDRKIPRRDYWKHLNLKERRDWYQGIITTIDAKRIPLDDKDGNNNISFIELAAEEYRNTVCAVEIANELFKIDNPSKEKATIREITEVLESFDDWHLVTNVRCGIYGKQRKVFERELIPY